jgi:HSP20 family protein
MMRLHHEMNRLFEDAFRGFDAPALWNRQWPSMEVQETEQGLRVTAELPGLEEKDVEVSFNDGVLTIRGEKRSQAEDQNRMVTERYYGRFERRLAVGDVDDAMAQARFKNGVLTIDLPRAAEAQDRIKRIPINNGEVKH